MESPEASPVALQVVDVDVETSGQGGGEQGSHEIMGNEGGGKSSSGIEEEVWTTYNDILQEPGSPVTLSTFSEITPVDDGPDTLPDSPMPENTSIQVWVSNPKQVDDTSKLGIPSAYTSYLVRCQTTLKSFPYKNRSVWRRFRDFDALHMLLRANHPGYFCPPLPRKNFIEGKRAKEEFVRARQFDLQKFLRQVTSHASLVEAEEVKLFLGIPEELNLCREWLDLLRDMKKSGVGARPQGGKISGATNNIKKDLRRTMRRVSDSFKKDAARPNRSVPDGEMKLNQTAAWLRELELELGACCRKARALLVAYKSVTAEMLHLGRRFITLAKFEEQSGQKCGQYTEMGHGAFAKAADMQKTGYAILRVHHFYRKFTMVTAQWLMMLEDQLSMVPAALAGMDDREKALMRIHDCEDQVEATRQRLDDLTRESSKKLGGLASSSAKSAQISSEIGTLVTNLGKLTQEYDRIRKVNEEEAELLTKTRHASLHRLVRGLAQDQVEMNENIAGAWRALGEQLSTSPVE